jgi:hypothetical protein
VRVFLGHASVKTTSVYLHSDEDRQEHVAQLRERQRPTLDARRRPRRRLTLQLPAGLAPDPTSRLAVASPAAQCARRAVRALLNLDRDFVSD